MPEPPAPSPVERLLADTPGRGRPLSRRARQTRRTLEGYMQAAVLPRYMQRLREIEDEIVIQRYRLGRAYERLRAACRGDGELFARRWRETAARWRFDYLNELIREHNDWYPLEARLPLDPRSGEYVMVSGRDYRRRPLDADWVLERFPASP